MKIRLLMTWLLCCLLLLPLWHVVCRAAEPSAASPLLARTGISAAELAHPHAAPDTMGLTPHASRFTSYTSAIPPTIGLEPAISAVQSGTVFTISVQIDKAVDLGAFEFTLAFNPAVLQVERVVLDSFLGSTGRSAVPLGPTINNQAGSVAFGAFSFGTSAGPDGNGTLALIGWRAAGPGGSALNFSGVQLTDSQGRPQVPVNTENGSVTVNGAGPTSSPTATGQPTASATTTRTATPSQTLPPTPSPSPTSTATATPSQTVLPSHTPTATVQLGRLYLPVILKGIRR
ncbi:MAG: hypothetical protein FJ026_05550 [Chloroflexi bacterium]|nr:hypothetical protein [Chloroflexota bacterium]